ncbi:GNAT family N-acetyltransferase [Burkholderiaceae bacterium UC74_6]
MDLRLEPVALGDFEAMHELRMAAMRESLERLGRFDPERSRARLAEGFEPSQMRHLCRDGERIGFLTLVPEHGALNLKHFYIAPGSQGQGVGAWAMAWVQGHGQDVVLNALKGSDANRFYQRHGFVQTNEDEFDIQYRWSAAR